MTLAGVVLYAKAMDTTKSSNLRERMEQRPNPDLIQEVVTTPAERAIMTLNPEGLHYLQRPTDLSAFFRH